MGGSSSKTQADSDDTHSVPPRRPSRPEATARVAGDTENPLAAGSRLEVARGLPWCAQDSASDGPAYANCDKVENAKKATCHIMLSNGRQGSGSLVDGTEFGFPRTCILTNQHVLEDVSAARSAIARFNYEHEDGEDAFEVELDPELGFISHKDEKGLDFCLVACSDDPMTRD